MVLYKVGPYAWSSRRLCILNQSVIMCDLLLPTGFKGSNVITSQRCDNVLGLWWESLGIGSEGFMIITPPEHQF